MEISPGRSAPRGPYDDVEADLAVVDHAAALVHLVEWRSASASADGPHRGERLVVERDEDVVLSGTSARPRRRRDAIEGVLP